MSKILTFGKVQQHSGNKITLEIITKDYEPGGDKVGFMLRIGKVYMQILWKKP